MIAKIFPSNQKSLHSFCIPVRLTVLYFYFKALIDFLIHLRTFSGSQWVFVWWWILWAQQKKCDACAILAHHVFSVLYRSIYLMALLFLELFII
jgi:hypothetical protein